MKDMRDKRWETNCLSRVVDPRANHSNCKREGEKRGLAPWRNLVWHGDKRCRHGELSPFLAPPTWNLPGKRLEKGTGTAADPWSFLAFP